MLYYIFQIEEAGEWYFSFQEPFENDEGWLTVEDEEGLIPLSEEQAQQFVTTLTFPKWANISRLKSVADQLI